MWAAGGKGRAAGWVGTHADKVLAAFWKGGDEGVRGDVEAELAAAGVHDAAEWAPAAVVAELLRAHDVEGAMATADAHGRPAVAVAGATRAWPTRPDVRL